VIPSSPARDEAIRLEYRVAADLYLRCLQARRGYTEEMCRAYKQRYERARLARERDYDRWYKELLAWSDATREQRRKLVTD
jgi:hypothetical protein